VGSWDRKESRNSSGGRKMVGVVVADRDTVSRRMSVKSPAWNSDDGFPKWCLKRLRADEETVSDTPMSWFPGSEAIYGDAVHSRNTFLKRRYSWTQLSLTRRKRCYVRSSHSRPPSMRSPRNIVILGWRIR